MCYYYNIVSLNNSHLFCLQLGTVVENSISFDWKNIGKSKRFSIYGFSPNTPSFNYIFFLNILQIKDSWVLSLWQNDDFNNT